MQALWARRGTALRVGEQKCPSGGEQADSETKHKHRKRLNSACRTAKARVKQALQDNQVSRMKHRNVSEERRGRGRFTWWEGEGFCNKGEGMGLLLRRTVSEWKRDRLMIWLWLCSLGEKVDWYT